MKRLISVFMVLVGLMTVSVVSGGLITGYAVWDWNWCSSSSPCAAGEGDCDRDSHCQTGYCAHNVGRNYGQSRGMDVCECQTGTWDGSQCRTTPIPQPTCAGDINNDGVVDLRDAVMVDMNRCRSGFDPRADVNNDGRIDLTDYTIILRDNWGRTCGGGGSGGGGGGSPGPG